MSKTLEWPLAPNAAQPVAAPARKRLGERWRAFKTRMDVPSILELGTLKTFSALVRTVPPRLSYRVAMTAADATFFLWRTGRQDTMTNLRHVLGPATPTKQVRDTARQAMRNYFRVLVEFLALRQTTRAGVMSRVRDVRGVEYVNQALERGHGAILVGIHHGSWDMAAVVATSYGWPITAVADTYRYPPLNEWVFAPRKAWGCQIISARESHALREVFRVLKRNEVLVLVIDRPMNGEGIPVRFFDADLSFPPGAAAIALKTGAPVIPGYFARLPDNTFVADILPPVDYTPSGDRQKDVQGLTQAIVTRLEEIVRRYPEQWYAFKPLWDADCQDRAN
jgi:KDO2-lipid IV(A) lauroyltransferase